MKIVYQALVESILHYGITVRRGAYNLIIDPLKKKKYKINIIGGLHKRPVATYRTFNALTVL